MPFNYKSLVPLEGFEPSDSWFRRPAPNPLAEVKENLPFLGGCLERVIGFEPTTFTLAT